MMRLIKSIFLWEVDNIIGLWYERAPSHANIADGPGRGEFSQLAGSKFFEVSAGDTSAPVAASMRESLMHSLRQLVWDELQDV